MIEVLSTVRSGRLVRSERLEDDGRIQSWVVAGERGAVEMRGDRADNLHCLAHVPSVPVRGKSNIFNGHSLLPLVDAVVFYNDRCPVLEGPCSPVLLAAVLPWELELADPWTVLEDLYRLHLEEG